MSNATAPTADFWNGVDPEIAEFERGLLESITQAKRGEGCVTTPEQIAARRQGRQHQGSAQRR